MNELQRSKLLWDASVNEAVTGATKAVLGPRDETMKPIDRIALESEFRGFACDVIYRYLEAKRRRGIFRRYYRWRDR